MSDLQQSSWRRRWGLHAQRGQAGGGGTERWHFAYKLDSRHPLSSGVSSDCCTLALGTQGVAPQKSLSCDVIPPKLLEFCCQTEKISWTLFFRDDPQTYRLNRKANYMGVNAHKTWLDVLKCGDKSPSSIDYILYSLIAKILINLQEWPH